jgi:S1-C subfamily serine protease
MTTQRKLFLATVLTGIATVSAAAQTPVPSPQPRTAPTVRAGGAKDAGRVIFENKTPAPQVVTILHRLNGLKVLSLLIRSREEIETIAKFGQAFNLSADVHTNIIAGLALDDGATIVAWLPEAEAEMPPPQRLFVPRTPVPPRAITPPVQGVAGVAVAPQAPFPRTPMGAGGPAIQGIPALKFQSSLIGPADLRIISRDGKRISGRYIGIDGLTGLSLITLTNGSLAATVGGKEETITVGQKLRVIGPQPAPANDQNSKSALYIRIGETEGIVTNVSRSPSGSIARVKVRSAKFSPANIGGIAINENNETLGIVDAIEGAEATIVPMSLVRMAAKRVLARNASVPRPWLGIKGEPVGSVTLERIVDGGWQLARARELTAKRQGILLTSVAPGSPAAMAKLKAGDVILSVNNGFIRNAEEFSWLLDEAGPDSLVHFAIARPEKEAAEAMEIKLSESPDPFFGLRTFERQMNRFYTRRRSVLGEGIETVALKPQAASRFGAAGGVLVVSVQPTTDAFKAGLRPGDVIESINGRPLYVAGANGVGGVYVRTTAPSTCVVVRNKEKISLTIQYSKDPEPDKP